MLPLDPAAEPPSLRFALPVFKSPSAPPRPPAPPSPVRLHATIALDTGTFRDVAPMLRAGVSVAPSPLRVEAALLGEPAGKVASRTAPEKGGELWLGGGAFSACYEMPFRGATRVLLGACGGVEGGVLVASSYGVTSPGTGVAPWVAPIVGGLLRWPFGHGLAVRLDALLAVPLFHPTFSIEGLGAVHEVSDATVRAGIGLEIDLTSR